MRNRPALVLERIGELQEQAAITDDSIAGTQAFQNLRLSSLALADFHRSAAELIRARGYVNERLIFIVAQHGGIRDGDGVLFDTCVHGRRDVHVVS